MMSQSQPNSRGKSLENRNIWPYLLTNSMNPVTRFLKSFTPREFVYTYLKLQYILPFHLAASDRQTECYNKNAVRFI